MSNNINEFPVVGRKSLQSDNDVINEADGIYHNGTQAVFTRPQGAPKRFRLNFNPDANTNFDLQTIAGPPEGKYWVVYNMEGEVPSGCGLFDFTLNGNILGMYLENAYGGFRFTDFYGQCGIEIQHDDLVQFRVTNNNPTTTSFVLNLYGRELDV